MNPYIHDIVCNSPIPGCSRTIGAGMSLRAASYSGRGTFEQDVTAGKITIIYNRIKGGEAVGHFPVDAADAFVQMVLSIPMLTGTAFVETLHSLDAADYQWEASKVGSESRFDFDEDDGSGRREAGAMATVFAALGGTTESTTTMRLRSAGIKADFLRRIGKDGLKFKKPIVANIDGTWTDGDRTYFSDPSKKKDYSECDAFRWGSK